MAKTENKSLKIKLVRSLIGSSVDQRKVATALGLRKRNQVVEHADTPIIRGMYNKISHLLEIVD